jgi:methionyl-tRNA synthetase
VSRKFYVTTAIDYSNGEPHLGHAYEKIGADCIARYRRLRGQHVHLLIGMDEHGRTVAQAAAARGLEPQELVDQIAAKFQDTWRQLQISHDQFIRTTSPAHRRGVQALIERIFARNPDDLYERPYEGWYCVGCEQFKRDSEIRDGRCILHPTRTLDWTEERNWFFRLTRYQEFLKRLFDERPGFLLPPSRRNEILALLDQGLEDVSVTRGALGWGIPFPRPLSTGEVQTTWVWFDALPNYLTATGFPDPGFEERWPADLHIIGKDITRLHCVIWPAQLESAGLPLPQAVWAHGFVLFGGARFSKSAGVTLDLDAAIARHGSDAFRYFLMREVPWGGDGSFTWERFDARYTAELADGLGNLVSRVVAMIARYLDGRTPDGEATELDHLGLEVMAQYARHMDEHLIHLAADQAWRLVDRANGFVEEQAPWTLANQGQTRDLERVLGALARALARTAVLLAPLMPSKTQEIWTALGLPGAVSQLGWEALDHPATAGRTVARTPPLFPKPTSNIVSY